MEGMGANISMAVPSGRRSQTGESSVKNMAMPKEAGTAMTKAISEVNNVPTIGTSAPYKWRTGSHSFVHKNATPKAVMEALLSNIRATKIASNRAKTKKAKALVTCLNRKSNKALRR